jgi:hypothetical protein
MAPAPTGLGLSRQRTLAAAAAPSSRGYGVQLPVQRFATHRGSVAHGSGGAGGGSAEHECALHSEARTCARHSRYLRENTPR